VSIELRHLRYFAAVANEGQISRAAGRLHLTQPSLSQAILDVEREVGTSLLQRHPRGVTLTPAGEAFLQRARISLSAAQAATDAARAAVADEPLVVGFLPPWSEAATRTLAAFGSPPSRAAPCPRELRLDDAVGPIVDGTVDVGFLWPPFDHVALLLEPVMLDRRMVSMATTHALARRAALTFADVVHEAVPARPPGVPPAWADVWHIATRRAEPANEMLEQPTTIDETAALVASSRGIFLGSAAFARALDRPGIVARPLVDVEPLMLSIARRQDNGDPRVLAFVEAALGATLARETERAAVPGCGSP
jgi:DNA-binding transcriptional LysR family regulator